VSVTGKRFSVTGCVQGVGYRYFCLKRAEELSIWGTAENKSDGSVEILAVGEASSLDSFLAALRDGPHSAEVDSIDIHALEQTEIDLIAGRGEFGIG